MIRIRFVVHVAAAATPFAPRLRSLAAPWLCFFRYLAYIGLVVIVNAVLSKLGVVA